MKLSITIPAYNEESAIAATVERCLASRQKLLAATDLDEVEVVVVSDGSTDRTVELATPYAARGEIRLVAYATNRGYGSALKRGFRESEGELVGFLDADGTCDPDHFAPLVDACLRRGADIACGCRMHAGSKMPAVRRLGNRIFRALISFLGYVDLRDSASGMRVIRREALPRLYPLPDGLHFTPAMSCRAALDPDLELVEIDMPYEERVGESKLSVVHDGLRFLRVIVELALTYRPFRVFGSLGLALLALAFGLGASIAWAKFVSPGWDHLPTWYLFRMMTALAAASIGLTLLLIGMVAERVAVLVQRHRRPPGLIYGALLSGTRDKALFLLGLLVALGGVALNAGTLSDWLRTGGIEFDLWWAYVITGAFLVITGAELMALAILDRALRLLAERRRYTERELEQDLGPARGRDEP